MTCNSLNNFDIDVLHNYIHSDVYIELRAISQDIVDNYLFISLAEENKKFVEESDLVISKITRLGELLEVINCVESSIERLEQ